MAQFETEVPMTNILSKHIKFKVAGLNKVEILVIV